MGELSNKFIDDSKKKSFDLSHRSRIAFNMGRYDTAVAAGMKQYADIELARQRAALLKNKVINNLDKYLIEFTKAFEGRGGQIIWAQNANEAVREILKIVAASGAKLVVKSKSMITEEIVLNSNLEKRGIEVIETDLGEYIVQVAGEKPYHIVTPAMHKSKEDIAELFHEKFGTPKEATPEEITRFVREKLRVKFRDAGIGITGCNFLVADTGSVCITENEGNAFLSFSVPKIHIAITGIEKIIPSLADLDLFWPLLATFGTGQKVTVYNSIISGPRRANETSGPESMYLVLLDNGRTSLMKQEKQRTALSCIRCGACLNACPVYRNVGGYTYNTTYSGPIGAVITPHMKSMADFGHLSFASSLCGKCSDVCPVKIPLHDLLLYNRNDFVKAGHSKTTEKWVVSGMKSILGKRKRIDFFGAGNKNMFMRMFMKKYWGDKRTLPRFAKKSFREMWLERES
ncbi:MAG: iron-sulfur cluster-binding protein [Bacteroidales bacterium]|nr:iron-sulfur cluster-binding protein [Bacteroidales bacterium]